AALIPRVWETVQALFAGSGGRRVLPLHSARVPGRAGSPAPRPTGRHRLGSREQSREIPPPLAEVAAAKPEQIERCRDPQAGLRTAFRLPAPRQRGAQVVQFGIEPVEPDHLFSTLEFGFGPLAHSPQVPP